MPRHSLHLLTIAALLLLAAPSLLAGDGPPRRPRVAASLAFEKQAVASESSIASRIGAQVLEKGGNAVDAAVATAFALAVTLPSAGNIGGGGFLLVRLPDGTATSFDFREKAPLDSKPDMFLDARGNYDPGRHHSSAVAVGVPGSVAGLHLAHERLGQLPWKDLVQPAIALAREGFVVTDGLADSLREALPTLKKYPASLAQFTRGGAPLRPGDVLVQPDLARTLERIRDEGPKGFYKGETARLIVEEMKRLGGLIRDEDLKRYRAVERKPVQGTYRGHEIIGMGPPSSGGVALIEMLNILEGYDLSAMGFRGARESHLLIEAMRRAFADRAKYLGDSDKVDVPISRLLSKEHAAGLRKTIDPRHASRSSPESFEWPASGAETTHLSVVDKDLMAVSLTTTLEESYGSGIVVPGAGFLLNNEMGDFNPRAGLPDAKGRIGTPPNLVEPEKRMLSSMSPTIVVRDGKPLVVVGTPGGRTIINTVLEVLVNVVDHGMSMQDAVNAPRFHHQWLPDKVLAEPWCFSPDTRALLETMGHAIEVQRLPQGAAMGIGLRRSGSSRAGWVLEAGVDPRRPDAGAAGN